MPLRSRADELEERSCSGLSLPTRGRPIRVDAQLDKALSHSRMMPPSKATVRLRELRTSLDQR